MLPNDWSQLQQAAKVQRQFLEKRLKTLGNEASKHLDALQEKIEVLYKQETSRDCPNWFDVYNKIGDSLRKSDLTINLKSTSWFFKDNTYKRYTQTYQRNTDKQTGITQLKDDSLNPAAIRGTVDDRVTLPEDWRKTSKRSMTRATSSRWLAGSSRNRRSCSLGKRLISPCLCPTGLVGRVGHSRGAMMLPNKPQETLMQKKLIVAMVGVGNERP
jgi:hypothetical protein